MSNSLKRSAGINITASGGAVVDQEVYRVPKGYHAIVTMFFLSNVGGSTTTVDAKWHDGSVIPFLGGKSLNAADYVQFGGGDGIFLTMSEDDYFTVSVASGGSVSIIISYELQRV